MTNLQEQLQNIKNQDNSYSKDFKTYEEQVSILKQRNLKSIGFIENWEQNPIWRSYE